MINFFKNPPKIKFTGKVLSKFDVPLTRQKMAKADGFESDEEALIFGNNACGGACLKMSLEALKVHNVPSVKEITEMAIEKKYYLKPVGWLHKGIVEQAKSFGIKGKVAKLKNPLRIAKLIGENKLIIASVSAEISPKRKGGHLIVVTGVEFENGILKEVYFNDPSGWGQTHSSVEGERFLKSWTGNVMILG